MPLPEPFQTFRLAISPFLPTWRSVEVRAIADLDRQLLLSLVACLSPESPQRAEEMKPTVRGIAFLRAAFPVSDLDLILQGFAAGVISIAEYELSTSTFSNFQYSDLTQGADSLTNGWPEFERYRSFSLTSYSHSNDILQEGGLEPIAWALGFQNFRELSQSRVHFPLGGGYSMRIEVFAPAFISVELHPSSSSVLASIHVRKGLAADDLSLFYYVQDRRGSRVVEATIDGMRFTRTESQDLVTLEFNIPLTESSASGESYVYYKPYEESKQPIASARFVAPALASEQSPWLRGALSLVNNTRNWAKPGVEAEDVLRRWLGLGQPRPQDKDLELGVHVLLFAMGLPSLAIGDAEGVDLLVLSAEPHPLACVVSCTTSPEIGRKIADLKLQRNRIQDALPNYAARAAIVVPAEMRDLRIGDVEECKASNVALLLKTDVLALFDQVGGLTWRDAKDNFWQLCSGGYRGTMLPNRLGL